MRDYMEKGYFSDSVAEEINKAGEQLKRAKEKLAKAKEFDANGNYKAAHDLYLEVFNECNDEYACWRLARIYEAGLGGIERDYTKAFFFHDFLAVLYDDRDEKLLVINMYFSQTYRYDPDKVKKYLEELVDLDDPEALIFMGSAYEIGDLYEKDIDKAVELYEKAGNLGEQVGYESIGLIYYYGRGGQKDYEKAFHYFSKQDKVVLVDSMFALGDMYEHGYGVDKNIDKAKEYYNSGIEEFEADMVIDNDELLEREQYERVKNHVKEL